jgi:hypothetical protein
VSNDRERQTDEHGPCALSRDGVRTTRLLGELYDRPEGGPGSCVEDAWNRMDDVIGMLQPVEEEPDRPPTREERRVAYRKVWGEDPPPNWPLPEPPRLRVVRQP